MCFNVRVYCVLHFLGFSWNPNVASELAIPHFLEEIHRPTMVAPVGDPDDPASGQQNTQKQHIVGISGV